jgi:hypothetical protein
LQFFGGGVDVDFGTQVPRQSDVVQVVANGVQVCVVNEQVVMGLPTMQAEVGPGGAGVMQTPDCRPEVEGSSVGVHVNGEGHVGVPEMAQGVCAAANAESNAIKKTVFMIQVVILSL